MFRIPRYQNLQAKFQHTTILVIEGFTIHIFLAPLPCQEKGFLLDMLHTCVKAGGPNTRARLEPGRDEAEV